MEIENSSSLAAELGLATLKDGNPIAYIVAKATCLIPPGGPALLAPDMLPVLYGDEGFEDEALSSVRMECDMVPTKLRTDIVLIGKAHAPGGNPATVVDTRLSVGKHSMTIRVVGDRKWRQGPGGISITSPKPFRTMDLVYERALGGVDQLGGQACKKNRLGRGFLAKLLPESLAQAELPNLEDPRNPVVAWNSQPDPVCYGFYPRNAAPRFGYLGTVDDQWSETRAPLLPLDFQIDYYNGAHPSLQLPYFLQGDEEVELVNLAAEGRARFRLPGLHPQALVWKYDQPQLWLLEEYPEEEVTPDPKRNLQNAARHSERVAMNLDTLVLIPEEKRFYLVWRGRVPLKSLDTFAAEIAAVELALADKGSQLS